MPRASWRSGYQFCNAIEGQRMSGTGVLESGE